jgi:septal ring factor EnvC (AmiA/AmiB activator)
MDRRPTRPRRGSHPPPYISLILQESIDQTETNLPTISSNYTAHKTTFNTIQSTVKALTNRITAFNEKTRGIYNTTMKLRYAYSSADGLKEKMASVENVMDGIVGRMDRLSRRLEIVEKLGVRHRLERKYRRRWLIMTGVCVFVGLAWAFLHIR